MSFVLELRNQPRGGPVVPARLTAGDRAQLSIAQHVTFLVHGFNVDRHDGMHSLGRFAVGMPRTAAMRSCVVAVLWPGDSWAGAAGYSAQGRDADDSAVQLARFIDGFWSGRPPRLAFVSHSLGARVVLETLRRLAPGVHADQLCLMAAAVDNDCLASSRLYRKAVSETGRVAALYSGKDRVLRWAYPLGDLLQAFVHWEDRAGLPLGLRGPRNARSPWETIPAQVLAEGIPDHRNAGHGDYLPPVSGALNSEQRSAASFVDQVVAGLQAPAYI